MPVTTDAAIRLNRPAPWPMTVAAYHALGDLGLIPEKTELLYGTVHEKMPKSPLHTLLLLRLLELIRSLLPRGVSVRPEQPITCLDSEPEPDLAVVQGSSEDYANAHPSTAELVVEICVTSHEYDRDKLRAYAQAGVKEVWLVLAPEQQVEVYREPAADHYAQHNRQGPESEVICAALPSVRVGLARLFGRESGQPEAAARQ